MPTIIKPVLGADGFYRFAVPVYDDGFDDVLVSSVKRIEIDGVDTLDFFPDWLLWDRVRLPDEDFRSRVEIQFRVPFAALEEARGLHTVEMTVSDLKTPDVTAQIDVRFGRAPYTSLFTITEDEALWEIPIDPTGAQDWINRGAFSKTGDFAGLAVGYQGTRAFFNPLDGFVYFNPSVTDFSGSVVARFKLNADHTLDTSSQEVLPLPVMLNGFGQIVSPGEYAVDATRGYLYVLRWNNDTSHVSLRRFNLDGTGETGIWNSSFGRQGYGLVVDQDTGFVYWYESSGAVGTMHCWHDGVRTDSPDGAGASVRTFRADYDMTAEPPFVLAQDNLSGAVRKLGMTDSLTFNGGIPSIHGIGTSPYDGGILVDRVFQRIYAFSNSHAGADGTGIYLQEMDYDGGGEADVSARKTSTQRCTCLFAIE